MIINIIFMMILMVNRAAMTEVAFNGWMWFNFICIIIEHIIMAAIIWYLWKNN